MRRTGLAPLTGAELIALGASRVPPSRLAELRSAGLTDYSLPELIGLALNGDEERFAAELRSAGLHHRPADELIALARRALALAIRRSVSARPVDAAGRAGCSGAVRVAPETALSSGKP